MSRSALQTTIVSGTVWPFQGNAAHRTGNSGQSTGSRVFLLYPNGYRRAIQGDKSFHELRHTEMVVYISYLNEYNLDLTESLIMGGTLI